MPTYSRILLLVAPVFVVVAISTLANAATHAQSPYAAVQHQPVKHHIKHSKKVRVKVPVRKQCGTACVRAKTLRAVVVKADRGLTRSGYSTSPLRYQLVGIVKAARAAGISPFFLLAIAGNESTFGVNACGGNAWGWAACRITFSNFTQGAYVVAEGLRVNYLDKRLNTIDIVSRTYCPPTSAAWAGKIHFIMTHVFRVREGLRWSDAVQAVKI